MAQEFPVLLTTPIYVGCPYKYLMLYLLSMLYISELDRYALIESLLQNAVLIQFYFI